MKNMSSSSSRPILLVHLIKANIRCIIILYRIFKEALMLYETEKLEFKSEIQNDIYKEVVAGTDPPND
jgi:hypothetical protein